MFWKQCKALFVPLIVVLLIAVVFNANWNPFAGAAGEFIWYLLLGIALGVVLGMMPMLYGGGAKERFATQRWFACGLVLAVILYQYVARFAGADIAWLDWLTARHPRAIMGEACLLGYCVLGALRAKR